MASANRDSPRSGSRRWRRAAPARSSSLQATLAREPGRFARILEASAVPGDIEELDQSLRSFIGWSGMTARPRRLRRACAPHGVAGHEAVNSALAELRATAAARGLELSRLAWTAISTRLLGAGAHARSSRGPDFVAPDLGRSRGPHSRSPGSAGRWGTRGGKRGRGGRLEPPTGCSRPAQVKCRRQHALAPRQRRMAGRRRGGHHIRAVPGPGCRTRPRRPGIGIAAV